MSEPEIKPGHLGGEIASEAGWIKDPHLGWIPGRKRATSTVNERADGTLPYFRVWSESDKANKAFTAEGKRHFHEWEAQIHAPGELIDKCIRCDLTVKRKDPTFVETG